MITKNKLISSSLTTGGKNLQQFSQAETTTDNEPLSHQQNSTKDQQIKSPTSIPQPHLEIDTDSFGIDGSATFLWEQQKGHQENLAKQDFDFLYDQKKAIYFNENGSDKGFGDGGIIAILKGAPELTASNIEFI